MNLNEPIFLGMDLPMLVSIPIMLLMFGFAVWYGATRAEEGIDALEAARRRDVDAQRN